MDYARLGRSGLTVSRVCLGGNSWGTAGRRAWAALDAAGSRPFFARALDRGVNFFDTADSYSRGASEAAIGEVLVGSVPRDELVLTTKVGLPMGDRPNAAGLGRKHVLASLDASLKRLRTDHVDVYMIHRDDPSTPVEEIMTTLAEIVRAGKARYLGASSMPAHRLARLQLFAAANGLPGFACMQNLYNLLYREEERETNPFCVEEGIALTPYSPLARGMLAGTRARAGGGETERAREDRHADPYRTEPNFALVERVAVLARARGVKPAQVALAWLWHKPGVVAPVLGPTRPDHLDDAAAALAIRLEPAEIAALEELYTPRAPM